MQGRESADGTENYRLRIEHAQVTNPAEVARFHELKVLRPCSPVICLRTCTGRGAAGAGAGGHSYAWAEFLNHGVTLAFGTDYPVEPVRRFADSTLRSPGKQRRRQAGIFSRTTADHGAGDCGLYAGSAYAEFADKDKGLLAPGMLADFVVLDRDLTAIPAAQILSTHVLRTVVGGKTVYESK